MALLTDNEQSKITNSKEYKEFLDKFKLPQSYEIPYKLGRLLALAYQAYESEQRQIKEWKDYLEDEEIPAGFKEEEFEYSPGGYVDDCAYGFLNLIREDL